MDYLVIFYEENTNEPQIKAKQLMNEEDVLVLYERMLHLERDQVQVLNYPSRLFEVNKLRTITDNS